MSTHKKFNISGKKTKIRGPVKAAYVYSILPGRMQSFLLTRMSRREIKSLNSGLEGIRHLTGPIKKSILAGFMRGLRDMRERRKAVIEQSVIIGLTIMAAVVMASFAYTRVRNLTLDGTINFIESIINNGGMHLILLPVLIGVMKARALSPVALLFASRNYGIDIACSAAAALAIFLIFFIPAPAGAPAGRDAALSTFTLLTSITAVPAGEELVFRYYFFYRAGERNGFVIMSIVSSLLFSAIHLPDSILLFVSYFLAGMILCGVYFIRKSLFPSLAAHAVSNLLIQVV
ncbi:MAG: hypothetical protein A2176_05870 [Spirochaetes bacterium RBG_13_51_14]|nr:MAG: hypothetical protein A2176_05870 [Spirochaetes bacterium RBG_13_51_14]